MAKKLTLKDALEIRRLYRLSDMTHQEIAERFDVTKDAVGKIIRGERWADRIREAENASEALSTTRLDTNRP